MNLHTSGTSSKRLLIIASIVFAIDQLTKIWIFKNIAPESYWYPHDADVIEVIQNVFYIVHIGNKGAAWGMFSGHAEWLVLVAVLALVAIYIFRHTLELHRQSMQFAFGLLITGIVSLGVWQARDQLARAGRVEADAQSSRTRLRRVA